jgi:uncharacterized Zn-binding protein involved in type VI secretion
MTTGTVPHVGGPVLAPGGATVFIEGAPAARVGDLAACAGPVDTIAAGEPAVMIQRRPAARRGDRTAHGGVVVGGAATVFIGGAAAGGAARGPGDSQVSAALDGADWHRRDDVARALVASMSLADIRALPPATRHRLRGALQAGYVSDPDAAAMHKLWLAEKEPALNRSLADEADLLAQRKGELARWNAGDQARFKTWFGTTDESYRREVDGRIDRMIEMNRNFDVEQFRQAAPKHADVYAYVYPTDASRTIYIGDHFDTAPARGEDSKAGTIAHEMSHFDTIGSTHDHAYGTADARALAELSPADALQNADNFEYYVEGLD